METPVIINPERFVRSRNELFALLHEIAIRPSRYAVDAAGMWLKRWHGKRMERWRGKSAWGSRHLRVHGGLSQ